MKKYGVILLGCLGICMLTTVSYAMADQKIAIVNLQRALNEVNQGKQEKTAIQAEVTQKQKQLESMKAELKKLRDELEKQKMVLSKEAMEQKANEIQTKFLDLQQKAVQFEQEIKKREGESVQRILVALRGMVIDIAKQGQYDMLYENSGETVLYSPKAIDVTDELIKRFNAAPAPKK